MKNHKEILEAINNFSKQKIVVIGDVMLDRYLWSEVKRISPEAPVPVAKITEETFVLGGAANTANCISHLGGKVNLIGLVGQDRPAKKLKSLLRENKVNTNGILTNRSCTTTLKTRIMCGNQQMIRFDLEKDEAINQKIERVAIKYFESIIEKTDLVVFSDYSKGFITETLAQKIIALANRNKIKILVDSKPSQYHKFKNVFLIKPNRAEAEAFSGLSLKKDFSNIFKVYQKFSKECKIKNLLITLGKDGMALIDQSKKVRRIYSHAEEVYDLSGAGDTVMAALALGAASGLDLEESASISSLCAQVVIAKVGTATCSQEELIKEYNKLQK